jgi:hypothetical protein
MVDADEDYRDILEELVVLYSDLEEVLSHTEPNVDKTELGCCMAWNKALRDRGTSICPTSMFLNGKINILMWPPADLGSSCPRERARP